MDLLSLAAGAALCLVVQRAGFRLPGTAPANPSLDDHLSTLIAARTRTTGIDLTPEKFQLLRDLLGVPTQKG